MVRLSSPPAAKPACSSRRRVPSPTGSSVKVTVVTGIGGSPCQLHAIRLGYQELAARGVRFDGPVQEAPWGRFATFEDPDGNGWVLQASTPAPRA
jgi:uncharacterized glyoxalase superfamily protein PhnB